MSTREIVLLWKIECVSLRGFVCESTPMCKFFCKSMFRFSVCVRAYLSVHLQALVQAFLQHVFVNVLVILCEWVLGYGSVEVWLWASAIVCVSTWTRWSVVCDHVCKCVSDWVSGYGCDQKMFVWECECEYNGVCKFFSICLCKYVCR